MTQKTIGVAIVSFASSDVIEDCLNSLLTSDYTDLKIVVCDNASPDNSRALIRTWAANAGVSFQEVGQDTKISKIDAHVTMINADVNLGYAGGVNQCLAYLQQDPDVGLFWVLNPDCEVESTTASDFAAHAARAGDFSLMGSRVLYNRADRAIQSDGGGVNRWTGVCSNLNQGASADTAIRPHIDSLDFISGANLVASRKFIETVGLMREDYFLYYEEVDWAMRRGDLPLTWCDGALVHHHGGTAIGSGGHDTAASGFSNYFNFRNRMWFMARFNKPALPIAYIYTLLKVVKIRLKDGRENAQGAWFGLNNMSPPQHIHDRIAPEARDRAFNQQL
ncbi:hypothetical protein BFP76_10895 [Amylibacter kogurei]|uniref:Glycosyltransferase 2-like domain-containing protein n=1 Tax=Paramylibacter kogurei TaxID=1889778 RepID=A0A2G5KBE7_9RHOB|nr:glycosyltransferase family 2 protein [Amylibacter kogurei]PIB26755.1 hypothetical protein BFP76_10895 [Amylibacter kogurei]